MQVTVKNYADYLWAGLDIGLCSQNDVINWADNLIEQNETIQDWMIDLSTSEGKHVLDVQHSLCNVPGVSNPEVIFRLLVAKLGKHYPAIQSNRVKLLRNLYRLVHTEISDELKSYIYRIDCDLDWLESDVGNWSVIEQDYKDLLNVGNEYRECIN